MNPNGFQDLVAFEHEKRRRVLETAYIGEDGRQYILKVEQHIDLHQHVRRWLMSDWDPIGISSMPDAANEYCSYEREISDLLQAGNEEKLAKSLNRLATERMGLTRDLSEDQTAASKLFDSFRAWVRNLNQENAA